MESGVETCVKIIKTLPKEKLLVLQRIVCEQLANGTTASLPGAIHDNSDDVAKLAIESKIYVQA